MGYGYFIRVDAIKFYEILFCTFTDGDQMSDFFEEKRDNFFDVEPPIPYILCKAITMCLFLSNVTPAILVVCSAITYLKKTHILLILLFLQIKN